MKLLQEKLSKYDAPQRAMAAGIYPYFRMIESDQDTEVMISGKKVLMFGSNAYLGLTNHPKVKEAAIDAIKKYGTGCAGSHFWSCFSKDSISLCLYFSLVEKERRCPSMMDAWSSSSQMI